jgi:hypothetical protein
VAKAVAIDESRNGKPSGIQLVQVEGFLEVARRGSVSRAAEVLFITQLGRSRVPYRTFRVVLGSVGSGPQTTARRSEVGKRPRRVDFRC